MTRTSPIPPMSAWLFVLSLAAPGCIPVAFADNTSQGAVSLRAGAGEHASRIGLAWESPPLWSYRFGGNTNRLDLTTELGVAYWKAKTPRTPASVWQFSAMPVLRWTTGERFYIEAGFGPTVFTRTHFANEEISTAFQFGSEVGMGVYLSRASRIGMRFAHFSNGGIKTPNPGFQILQLTYTYQY